MLHKAAEQGNLAVVKYLVSKGADVRKTGGNYVSLLHTAARNENVEIIKFLVSEGAGADIHMKAGLDGDTPFHRAAFSDVTLETVKFFRRDKYECVPFEDIPPVVFSESMRDIDLAVSVAHAGGVDPEASHSTIEMRIAILRELLSMLSVDNVSFKTSHALIQGSMGEYSVHMGSGVVHKSGTGMISVLPVHSQSRGRIFLPFADDDPKTAEVLSKILLFADDKKIKDPGILEQIR